MPPRHIPRMRLPSDEAERSTSGFGAPLWSTLICLPSGTVYSATFLQSTVVVARYLPSPVKASNPPEGNRHNTLWVCVSYSTPDPLPTTETATWRPSADTAGLLMAPDPPQSSHTKPGG